MTGMHVLLRLCHPTSSCLIDRKSTAQGKYSSPQVPKSRSVSNSGGDQKKDNNKAAKEDASPPARRGVGDPDRRDPKHDLAITFLAKQDVLSQILKCHVKEDAAYKTQVPLATFRRTSAGVKYTDVGFLDGLIYGTSGHVLVEVKIAPVSLGEVLRQLKTYRGLVYNDGYGARIVGDVQLWLATAFDFSVSEAAILQQENILWLRLGPAFDTWIAADRRRPGTANTTL